MILQTILFGTIGVAILYFLWQIQGDAYQQHCQMNDMTGEQCKLSSKLYTDFRNADWRWLLFVCVIYMLSNIVRALRWQMLIRPMGYGLSLSNSFFAIMISYFANLGLPRVGEFVRAVIVRKYEKIPVEKAFGTIIMDRFVDFLCLLILLVLGLVFHYQNIWSYLTSNLKIPVPVLIALPILGFMGLAVAIVIYRKIERIDDSQLEGWKKKLKNFVMGLVEGIVAVRKVPNMPLFVFYSLGIWFLYLMMHYFAFFAYEPTSHLTFIDSILVFDFGSLGIVFPSPGGMGSYHALIVESLKIVGVDSLSGFSFSMITFFTITIFCNVLFGLISLLMLPMTNKS
jgi:uncharacterized protein (TIRG00374 family)